MKSLCRGRPRDLDKRLEPLCMLHRENACTDTTPTRCQTGALTAAWTKQLRTMTIGTLGVKHQLSSEYGVHLSD